MPLHVSGVTCPSSGGSAQMLFDVITCVGCDLVKRVHACIDACGDDFQHIL
jgi:Fe-S-cluster-containing dehydrogenase component